MPVITFDEHDTAHDRRHQAQAVGRLVSCARVVAAMLRTSSMHAHHEVASLLADAALRAEQSLAPELPIGGKTRAVAQLDRHVDSDGEAQA